MKKLILIIAMLAMALGTSAQPPMGGHDRPGARPEQRDDRGPERRDDRYRDDRGPGRRDDRHQYDDRRRNDRHGRPEAGPRTPGRRQRGYAEPVRPLETPCVHEWQELWNGCHVRISDIRVKVLDREGNRVVSGEEVVLLGNGSYMVRTGDTWRIYDWRGGFTIISGHEIHLWPNGLYLVRFSSNWRVYNPAGDRLTNVWGDRVDLMPNGLIRCDRAGRFFYYDEAGNERR